MTFVLLLSKSHIMKSFITILITAACLLSLPNIALADGRGDGRNKAKQHQRDRYNKHNRGRGHSGHSRVHNRQSQARRGVAYRSPKVVYYRNPRRRFHIDVYSPIYCNRPSIRLRWSRNVYRFHTVNGYELAHIENRMLRARSDGQAIEIAERKVRNQAINIRQLGILMQTLEFDEARLDLVYALYPNLLNPNRIHRIYPLLSNRAIRQLERTL